MTKKRRTVSLHSEMYQIVVSRDELYRQFMQFGQNENLFNFLMADKDSSEYKRLLNLLGVKFELIGSFNYVSKASGRKSLAKPPIKTYYRYIFDNFCESVEECMSFIPNEEVANKVFDKYRAIRYYLTPMLASISEQSYTPDFMGILDYVARNDNFPVTTFHSITGFPETLRGKIKNFDWSKHDIHG